MLKRRVLRFAALLAVFSALVLIVGCSQSGARMYSFKAGAECEERDCGCGVIEIAGGSGDALETPGEVLRGIVPEGLVVVAKAIPEPGWAFSHWSGHTSGEDSSGEVLVDHGIDITAHFVRIRPLRVLELRVVGVGGVDGGPCCPQSTQLVGDRLYTPASAEYGHGEIVRLAAFPAGAFHGWIGYGIEDTLELIMDQDRSITVLFYDDHQH